jgi:hypothetical protein
VDRRNIGNSAIISSGQGWGGALWEFNVKDNQARVVDCKHKLERFDGQRNPHYTLSYGGGGGKRFSVVAYIHRGE